MRPFLSCSEFFSVAYLGREAIFPAQTMCIRFHEGQLAEVGKGS